MIIPRVQKKRFRVDMAPLIDVVFLLLIFFMLTFAIQGKGIDLSLPRGVSETGSTDRPPVIRIQGGDQIHLDSRLVDTESLIAAIRVRVKTMGQKSVVIEAGPGARYELFVQVMDISRQAGVRDFSIVSEDYQ